MGRCKSLLSLHIDKSQKIVELEHDLDKASSLRAVMASRTRALLPCSTRPEHLAFKLQQSCTTIPSICALFDAHVVVAPLWNLYL